MGPQGKEADAKSSGKPLSLGFLYLPKPLSGPMTSARMSSIARIGTGQFIEHNELHQLLLVGMDDLCHKIESVDQPAYFISYSSSWNPLRRRRNLYVILPLRNETHDFSYSSDRFGHNHQQCQVQEPAQQEETNDGGNSKLSRKTRNEQCLLGERHVKHDNANEIRARENRMIRTQVNVVAKAYIGDFYLFEDFESILIFFGGQHANHCRIGTGYDQEPSRTHSDNALSPLRPPAPSTVTALPVSLRCIR